MPLWASFALIVFGRGLGLLLNALCWSCRLGAGSRYTPSKLPKQPLELWSYESSPYCKACPMSACPVFSLLVLHWLLLLLLVMSPWSIHNGTATGLWDSLFLPWCLCSFTILTTAVLLQHVCNGMALQRSLCRKGCCAQQQGCTGLLMHVMGLESS